MTIVRKWLRDHVGLVIIALLLFVLSPTLTEIVPNEDISTLVKLALIVGNITLAVVTAWEDVARSRAEQSRDTAHEQFEREHAEQLSKLRERGVALQRVAEEMSNGLTEVRTSMEGLTSESIDDNEEDETLTKSKWRLARQAGVKASLAGLCNTLAAESVAPLEDPLKAIYFKATLFEYIPDRGSAGVLQRMFWHYPPTIQPRTEMWDINNDFNSAAVIAFITRQELAIPDISVAFKEGQWKDGRPDQHKEYGQSSMVCVPIWGEALANEPSGPAVRGVMTIDTNQLGYFKEGEAERAVRAQVFGPFIGLIRLVYRLTEKSSSHAVDGKFQASSS